jgi:predicted Ser/Thr protein kinase
MDAETRIEETAWPGYALPQGSSVNGYRIERLLGSGGFGVTYLASDLLGQRFAIKEYYPRQFATRSGLNVVPASAEDQALFQDCRERFLREGQALVMLGRVAGASQGIVRVQTCFEAFGTCFLVMDFIEGRTLASVLRQYPEGMDAPRLLSLLTHLLDSIRIVHSARLLHRDIKPANIILRDDDRPVLIDFGSTRDTANGESTQFTQIYTSGYAPPEQRLGLPQDRYSDIYAIGAVGYRALGGTPVDALSRQHALGSGKADPQKSAVELRAGRYPKPLLAAIDAALAIDAARRPQTAEGMLALLGFVEPGEPAVIRAGVHAGGSRGGRKAWWGVAAGAGVLAALGAGYLLVPHGGGSPTAAQKVEIAAATNNSAPSSGAAMPDVTAAHTTAEGSGSPPQPAAGGSAASDAPASGASVPEAAPPASTPGIAVATDVPPRAAASPDLPSAQPPAASPAQSGPDTTVASDTPATPLVSHAADQAPQREALLVPPVHTPPPAPEPSPAERAQQVLAALPCAALRVQPQGAALQVDGFAGPGPALEQALGDVRRFGPVTDHVERVASAACAPLGAFSGWFAGGQSDAGTLTLALRPAQVKSGARLRLEFAAALPVVQLDVYQPDGMVEHIASPARPRSGDGGSLEWAARLPPGEHLVVAVASRTPLLGRARPEHETAAAYLAALRTPLQSDDGKAAVAFALLKVEPADPKPAARPAVSHVNPRPEKCANILSRVQLGEVLSDAERATLRNECRS